MKDKVASLELSKKLHEAGIKVKTEFYWYEKDGKFEVNTHSNMKQVLLEYKNWRCAYPAPLAVELGELLMKDLPEGEFQELISWYDSGKKEWIVRNALDEDLRGIADTEPNARAKMLLYLHENNLLPKGEK